MIYVNERTVPGIYAICDLSSVVARSAGIRNRSSCDDSRPRTLLPGARSVPG